MPDQLLRELSRFNIVNSLYPINRKAVPDLTIFVENVTKHLNAPIGLLSVARGNRLYFKATFGLGVAQELRKNTFCHHVLDAENPLEVCDARENLLFSSLPVVTGFPGVRYYLGVSIVIDGVGVGALCVLDTTTRPPASSSDIAYVNAVSKQTAAVLEQAQ